MTEMLTALAVAPGAKNERTRAPPRRRARREDVTKAPNVKDMVRNGTRSERTLTRGRPRCQVSVWPGFMSCSVHAVTGPFLGHRRRDRGSREREFEESPLTVLPSGSRFPTEPGAFRSPSRSVVRGRPIRSERVVCGGNVAPASRRRSGQRATRLADGGLAVRKDAIRFWGVGGQRA